MISESNAQKIAPHVTLNKFILQASGPAGNKEAAEASDP
jgi:hypothetical protein